MFQSELLEDIKKDAVKSCREYQYYKTYKADGKVLTAWEVVDLYQLEEEVTKDE